MKELVKTLVTEFSDKEYAHAYMEEFSNMAIAAQIKVLREQHGWTQAQLATAADMKQERISMLENVEYDAWTIKTLRKLAKAFDVTLKVSFEKFSDGIAEIAKLNAENLKRTAREPDLKEFSDNVFKYKTTSRMQPVTTTKTTLRLMRSDKVAANDVNRESNPQVA